jgi:hypothetical protein
MSNPAPRVADLTKARQNHNATTGSAPSMAPAVV